MVAMSEQPTADGPNPNETPQGTPDQGAGARSQRWTRAAPWIAVAIAVAVIAADQLSKFWAEQTLTLGERTPLIGDLLGIQLAYNAGAAFSLGTGATWIFTILA